MRGVRIGKSDSRVHDLWSHRLLREQERSRVGPFEIKRPPVNPTVAHFGQLLHVVLRLQRVSDLVRLAGTKIPFGFRYALSVLQYKRGCRYHREDFNEDSIKIPPARPKVSQFAVSIEENRFRTEKRVLSRTHPKRFSKNLKSTRLCRGRSLSPVNSLNSGVNQ